MSADRGRGRDRRPDPAAPARAGGAAAPAPGSGSAGSAGPAAGNPAAESSAGTGATGPGELDGSAGQTGPELARAVLDAALARRAARQAPRRTRNDPAGDAAGADGSASGGGRDATGRRRAGRPRGYSGPGPDPRDPQLLGVVLQRLVRSRGWQRPTAEATVFGAWERVVGADVASHSRPVKLEDGELTVEAESTAWATQLRLLAGSLLRRIAAEVGHDVVRRLHIHGPAAPSWSRGPRRVRGRGPRDTYG